MIQDGKLRGLHFQLSARHPRPVTLIEQRENSKGRREQSAVAQHEREMIAQRTKDALQAAKMLRPATNPPMPPPSHNRRIKRVPTPDRRRALESIYALVIASLMVPAVALALMPDRVLAAESQMPDLKPLFEFLDSPDECFARQLSFQRDMRPETVDCLRLAFREPAQVG
jgi:hypothetical protein